jgi:hypothetical protein
VPYSAGLLVSASALLVSEHWPAAGPTQDRRHR